jgi:hypothetical protein
MQHLGSQTGVNSASKINALDEFGDLNPYPCTQRHAYLNLRDDQEYPSLHNAPTKKENPTSANKPKDLCYKK